MNVGIVDDHPEVRQKLHKMIENYCNTHSIQVEIWEFGDGIELVEQEDVAFDLLYLDIQMAILDGMKTAKKIRHHDKKVKIIFVSSHMQYAIEGYQVAATDFLLKPISEFNFNEHFKKIIDKLDNENESYLDFKEGKKTRRLPLNQVLFFESDGNYLKILTQNQQYHVLGSIQQYEKELAEKYFFRCANSFLVNLAHVSYTSGSDAYIGDYKVPITRLRKKDFLNALTEYLAKQ